MATPRRAKKPSIRRPLANQRRTRVSFSEALSQANQAAHEKANRKMGRRGRQFVWAAVAESEYEESGDGIHGWTRLMRWMLGSLLLPLCWVTGWTFLSRFSQAALDQDFWKTAEFWYFATGALVMSGWFWSGLLQGFFLYLYVLGHELTHVLFVWLFRGKVTDFHVSTRGGYITTNKTNLVIALSPYFVPFWSVVCVLGYAGLRLGFDLPQEWDRLLYAALGLTWTFHIAWTLWMIPRDQPDLKENGTFLSLVVILLANLLILAALLCLASESPLVSARDFWLEWLRHSAVWGDAFLRWTHGLFIELRAAGRL
jgi:hypothetical protein